MLLEGLNELKNLVRVDVQFLEKSFSMYDGLFKSMLTFTHCSSSMYADDLALETVALGAHNNVAVFVTVAPAKRAPTIGCFILTGQVSNFPTFSRGQSLNTISNSFARALQNVNK
jgi:hypothetical protein